MPESAIEDYRSTKSWSDFGTILEIELNGINDVKASANDSPYYSLGGIQTKSPSKGINIIRQSDGKTRKVIVK